ncbi:MAG: histidinol-phosphatase [Candidatus Marinimicrobia bacterium]|nr:histidinol-phosphatase [Candidatus Neomarinimicrobiota bacterium]
MIKLNEYIGCIHGHSVYSDGSGTYPKIISAAIEAELDYLMMSDHMTLQGKDEGFVGWHQNLFLSIGYEINDPEDQHHYLAFGLDKTLPETYSHKEYLKAVKDKNALGIAAHPLEERDSKNSLPGFPPITWRSLDYPEIEVIEIWNMMSHWLESTTLKNRYWNVVHPRSFSTSPSKKIMQWWDKANIEKKVTGVGSVDVHAKKIKILGFFSKAIFDYKIMFKSIRTHLLIDKPILKSTSVSDTEQIIFNTIFQGKSFISNYRRGDARGFRFWAEMEDKEIQMGEMGFSRRAILRAIIPEKSICKVIRNGKVFYLQETKELNLKVHEGLYRLEIERDERGWIFTNHIRIKES